jgi:pyridinium-3,5-biscarboxylic acid mononucleotide sulfurtransferase
LSTLIVEGNESKDNLVNYDDSLVAGKESHLREIFREMGSVLIAYSGGVDSSYVAYVANAELGAAALCVTGESPSLAEYQRLESATLAGQFGFNREIIRTDELDKAGYTANGPNRCYFCKEELYQKLRQLASSRDIQFIVDGSTCDDLGDYRPGRTAAAEYGVRSPLIEAGMTKSEVRLMSRKVGLPTWDKPASPCLSSRIAYGTPVTIQRLTEVDRGEEILRSMGFREFRVRHHDNLVRLEIARGELSQALRLEVFSDLTRRFRELGFKYVTLDLEGYRSGAMNEVLAGAETK